MTKKIMRRTLFMLIVMIAISFSSIAYAGTVEGSGTCGDNATWTLDSEGVLTISGEGRMDSFDNSFRPYKVKEVIINKGITSISDSAFAGGYDISKVTIPNSVTDIGPEAFTGCSSLESITIPDGVTTIGYFTFGYCSSLKSITIPDSVTTIGDYAFYNCSMLESITIPNSVTDIGRQAFDMCSSLESITIPENVTEIKPYTFANCNSLKSITIPDSVTEIGGGAFNACSKLESITIPDSIIKIGGYAFYACSSLESITIPDSVTLIHCDTFANCSSLKSITIPNSITMIEYSAFANCRSLESITIPNGVTEIEYSTFENCSSLKSITIPERVTKIGDFAFEGCSGLESITIPDSVTEIGDRAFSGCSNRLVIYGDWYSYAQTYAHIHDIEFQCIRHKLIETLPAVEPSCIKTGLTEGKQCIDCRTIIVAQEVIPAKGHSWKASYTIDEKSTMSKDGIKSIHCSRNDCTEKTSVTTVPKISEVTLSSSKYTYNGSAKKPTVTVKDSEGNKLVENTDYTVSYDSGRTNVGTYKVTVKFKGNYEGSVERNFTISLATPTNVKISNVASSGKLKITWSKVTGADKYYVYRSATKDGTYSYLSSTSTTSYVDTSAVGGKVYYYKVRAIYNANSNANSAQSSYIYSRCDLAQPAGLKISNVASSGKLKITWNKVSGADKYYVYRSATKDGTYSYLSSTSTTSYVDTSAVGGKVYYYKVRAIYNANSNANSAQSSYTYSRCDLAQPIGLKISNVASSGKLKITWSKVTGADKYYVYRSTTKDGTYSYLRASTTNSYIDNSAVVGKVYYYKVRAVYSANENANSVQSSYTYSRCDLAQPTGLNISNVTSSGKLKITWSKVEGADKYYVYRSTTKDGTYSYLKASTTNSYVDTSAVAGKLYYYKVRAVYSANENANSAQSGFTYARCKLAQPTGLKISTVSSSGNLKITWTAVEGASKYEVWRKVGYGGTYVKYYTTSATTFTNSSVEKGKTYYYKIKAIHGSVTTANSEFSNVVYRTAK